MSKRKEMHAWDRFWLWIKENEKVIWVALLLILAPTFAFPIGSILFQGRGRANHPWASTYDKTFNLLDFKRAQRDIEAVQRLRGGVGFTTDERGVLHFLTQLEEADRLGIHVGDPEVGAAVRRSYWELISQQAGFEAAQKLKQSKVGDQELSMTMFQVYQARLEELEKKNEFGDEARRDWYERLQALRIDREEFEDALRRVMRAEKVEEFVRNSVQVTPDDAFQEFMKSEQTRKFSFLEVRADEAKAEVEKSITDAEIQSHYEKSSEDFREPLKIRTDYLTLPVALFEKEVTLTDDDLRREYDRVKLQKYQTFAGGGVEGSFELLSPEEKAARDRKAFRPFEEVKEEVRAELLKTRTRDLARAAADKIRDRLFPQKPGTIGKKEEEKPAPPAATYADIVKDYPAAKTGTTPWVERKDAEKTLGEEVYSYQFLGWFSLAEGTGRDRTPKKDIEAPRGHIAAPIADPQHFIFYANPKVRPAGVPKLEECRDKVREALVKEKLLAAARDKARKVVDAIRDGKLSLEDAAKGEKQAVVTTAFIERSGAVKVPLTPEERAKAEEEAKKRAAEMGGEEVPPAKDKDHPGSRTIVEFGFKALREKGKVDGFAEDPENAACYVVRLDDQIFPDEAGFEAKRKAYTDQVRSEKQRLYLAEWLKSQHQRAKPGFFGRGRAEEE